MNEPLDPQSGVVNNEAIWERADHAREYRLELLKAGYVPLPVNGKKPVLTDWPNIRPDAGQIRLWAKACWSAENTGILTELTPGFDIDAFYLEAAEAAEELVRQRYQERGRILVRIGRQPKRLIPFRTDKPFNKIEMKLIPPGCSTLIKVIEFLGNGQQFVARGIHPDTKRPYTWHGGEPGQVAQEDLPYITGEEAQRLVDDVAELLVREFGYQHRETRAKVPNDSRPISTSAGVRERQYAKSALEGCASELATTPEGDRNDTLNKKAFRLGTMVARGWVARESVHTRLLAAALASGLEESGARPTLESGLTAGEKQPHEDLAKDGKSTPPIAQPQKVINLDPCHGELMLNAVHQFLGRFVVYPSEHAHDAHALWCVHAHLMQLWDTTPRIAFLSPEPASGKSRALEVTELLVPNPVLAVNVSPPYLFRKVAGENGRLRSCSTRSTPCSGQRPRTTTKRYAAF